MKHSVIPDSCHPFLYDKAFGLDREMVCHMIKELVAALKTDNITCRVLQQWMSEEILFVKREKWKSKRT